MKFLNKQKGASNAETLIGLAIIIWLFASWLTHIIVCLDEEKWGFLIAGAIMVPIAVAHGTGIWLGFF